MNEETINQQVEEEVEETKKKKEKHISKKEYDKLVAELEEEKEKVAQEQQRYAKALETAAYHKNLGERYQREYDSLIKYRSQALIESLLNVIDNFELAFKFEAPTKEAQNYRVGFEFVYKMMLESLKGEGLEIITPTVNQEYDAKIHQAIEAVETEDEASVNKIAEVLLNGYKVKDRVVRPSTVKVYVLKKEEKVEEVKEEAEALKN